mmetsp:Transcript_19090/g.47746  ORF Transcript_19090/g.47746 Transcript_19090/m.47746 type:complete len:128 (-) Transcript_19090:3-386(-)
MPPPTSSSTSARLAAWNWSWNPIRERSPLCAFSLAVVVVHLHLHLHNCVACYNFSSFHDGLGHLADAARELQARVLLRRKRMMNKTHSPLHHADFAMSNRQPLLAAVRHQGCGTHYQCSREKQMQKK